MLHVRWRPFALSILVVIADRISKRIIESQVQPWEQFTVIPGLFQIVHTRNTGIAFGMLQSESGETSSLLVVFSVLVMAFIGTLLWTTSKDPAREHWTLRYGLGCIFGGAVGNLYDRIFFGSVTDFLDFYWGPHHFPVFNVADSAITIGAGLLLLNLWAARTAKPARSSAAK